SAPEKKARLPETSAGKMAQRMLEIIGTWDDKRALAFVQENYSEGVLKHSPAEEHVAWLRRLRQQSGRLAVGETEPVGGDGAVFCHVRSRRGAHRAGMYLFVGGTPARVEDYGTFALPDPTEKWPQGAQETSEVIATIRRNIERRVRADTFSGTV